MKTPPTNLAELGAFLQPQEIPVVKDPPQTFLGIARQPHYENVISNIYAFYFREHEEHGLSDLFISSLLEVIAAVKEQSEAEIKLFEDFQNVEVYTEYGITDQKRIDILLRNDKQAIIIESKIYHHLGGNDLEEYYNAIAVGHKIGIVLSLHPVAASEIKHPHFINITHLALLQKVMERLPSYEAAAVNKYVVFLRDFYQNIVNLSHPFMEKTAISFYYNNQEKINQLVDFKSQLSKHLQSEVSKLGQSLNGVTLSTPRSNSVHDQRLAYYRSDRHPQLMITVVYDELLQAQRVLHLIVELQGELLKDRNIYKNEIDFADEEQAAFADHFENTTHNWAHFAAQQLKPTQEEIANLSSFINESPEKRNLFSIFNKIVAFLDERKSKQETTA